MKDRRKNWRKLGIERLTEMGYTNADKIFENTYRKVLHRMRKAGSSNLNIQRETYFSMFARGTQVANVEIGARTSSVELSDIINQAEDVDTAFVSSRIGKLAETYDEVNQMLLAYKSKAMTYEELKQKIKQFKETNEGYLKRNKYSNS